MVKINGKEVPADGQILQDFLKKEGYRIPQIVVESNEHIVPKSNYGQHIIKTGDVIEIVSFMGGGSCDNSYMR